MKKLILILAIISGITMSNAYSKPNSDGGAVLLPVKNDPTVSFSISFRVGSCNDPKGKEGLAAMTAKLITGGGNAGASFEQILVKLYPMAAGYSAKTDKELTTFTGRVHKDNLKAYYEILKGAILTPNFDANDFQRIKSDMLNNIEKDLRYASDEELGKAVLSSFVFKGTPYESFVDGTVQGIQNITLQDVKDFYKKYYTKENYTLGLGGGYDAELLSKIQNDLNTLNSGKPELVKTPVPEQIKAMEFVIVDKDCDATAISFGYPIDVLRGDEDFFALALFNSWFGEHRNSSSHLYQVIRETRGMNYGDYSYIEAFLNGGGLDVPEPNNPRRKQMFEVWLRPVQNENRMFALRAALRELKLVVDNGMTKEQFELTKKFLYKYALNFAQTTTMRLGYQIDSKFYGLKDKNDYIELFRSKIKALTLEKVNAAIKKHIRYDKIRFAVVTKDAGAFKQELIIGAPSPIVYPTPKPKEVLEEDKTIQAFPISVSAENVKIVKVEEVFAK